MPKNIQGPGIFLAQFAGDSRRSIRSTRSAAGPPARLQGRADPDLGRAAVRPREGRRVARPIATRSRASPRQHGVEITELSTHLQGQLVAVHPAYDEAFDAFAPPSVRGNPKARQEWAVEQMHAGRQGLAAISASTRMSPSPARSPGPIVYPWPQRPPGLIETAFDELAQALAADPRCLRRGRRRRLLRDPSRRGPVRRRHLRDVPRARSSGHPRCSINYDPSHFVLQQLDYLAFIDIYHERIKAFHVKDAEFNPTGRQGVYSRLPALGQPRRPLPLARRRPGRLRRRSSRSSPQYDYDGWAVLEWECCLKHPEEGAREGAPFIAQPHHPGDREGLRRFRRRRHRRGGQPARCSAWPGALRRSTMAIEGRSDAAPGGGSGSAWSAAGRAPSSAPCTASRRGWTTSTSWSPARCRPTPETRAALGARRSASTPDRCLRRLRRDGEGARPARRTASRRWRSSRRTTCTMPAATRLPRGRHPRHLRQAADDDARPRREQLAELAPKTRR